MDPNAFTRATLHDDPVLEAEVEHAIAPYRGLLSPELLDVLRDNVIRAYTEHPVGQRILRHLREAIPTGSGTVNVTLPNRAPGAAATADAGADQREEAQFQPRASGFQRKGER
jgi:hypothetical protein